MARTDKFSFRIASDESREKVFAEVFYGSEQWAEVNQEGPRPHVLLFPPDEGVYWDFTLEEAISILDEAKKCLLEE